MNADELRARQAPVKSRYRDDPAAARQTLVAEGALAMDAMGCRVTTAPPPIVAGLHPSAGGDGSFACAGDMLLQALVGCAGVTLAAVATALQIPVRGGTIRAEGVMDFRGTLGIAKDVAVGFQEIHLAFALDTDATPDQLENLLRLTRRYCVVYQTLVKSPVITESVTVGALPPGADEAMKSGLPEAVAPYMAGAPLLSSRGVEPPVKAWPGCTAIMAYMFLGAIAFVIFAFTACMVALSGKRG